MRVKFWGVRGSIPTSPTNEEIRERLVETLLRFGRDGRAVDLRDRDAVERYVAQLPRALNAFAGGSTSCVEVRAGDELLIIDFGSGLRRLGDALMQREFAGGRGRASLLLSHFHYDHLQGWPFFKPAYVAGNAFDLYCRFPDALERLEQHQRAPFFPAAAWGDMVADFEFHPLPATPISVGQNTKIKVSTLKLEHPSGSYAFRLESENAVLVYASDGAYPLPNGAKDDEALRYIDFFRDADLVIFDAQYSLAQSLEKHSWGHSSAIVGVELAARAGAKRLALFHHDPASSDEFLEHHLRVAQEYAANPPAPCAPNAVEVILAREDLEIVL